MFMDYFTFWNTCTKTSNPLLFIVAGDPGSGKSCTLAMLAIDWAENKGPPELQQFHFVFFISLRDVDDNIPLEEVVIKQHGRFKARQVPKEHVKAVLDGSSNNQVLLLFDGYDEYKKGTNSDIDKAITDTIGDCFLIITSRPGEYMDKTDQDQMDGEIKIKGLSPTIIKEYALKFLSSQILYEDMLNKSLDNGTYSLLKTPVILLMICVLYFENKTLPENQTDLVWEIIKMYVERAKAKGGEMINWMDIILKLGELSWIAPQRERWQLLIRKVNKGIFLLI